MALQSHSWYGRLWRKVTQWFQRPTLPSAILEGSARTVTVMQWQLNGRETDHNHSTVRIEVELISEPPQKAEESNYRITHPASERLH